MSVLVLGMGYSGRAFAEAIGVRHGPVAGTTRSTQGANSIEAAGARPMIFDGKADEALREAVRKADAILVSIAPDEEGDPVLRALGEDLRSAPPAWLGYLSTVGVYGDHGGAWVDEETECRPVSARSRHRAAAERAWQAFGRESGAPVAVLRLSGIYGPGRSPLDKLRRGEGRRIVKPGQVFNRIHVADIAQACEAAMVREEGGLFNVTDDEPAPPQDVVAFAARLLTIAPPPEIPFEKADLTPMGRSFYGENKRVRNAKMKSVLGVRLAYPTYREGLKGLLAQAPHKANIE